MRWRLAPYYGVTFLNLASLGSVATLLAEFRAEFGLDERDLGIVVGAGFLTSFIASVTLGRFADRGLAPTMIRIGLVVLTASLVLMALGSSLLHLVIARAVLGLAVGMMLPAIRRTVIVTDRPNMGRNLGRLVVVEISGLAAGPLMAAVIVEVSNVHMPFWILAGAVVVVAVMIRPEADTGERSAEPGIGLDMLRNRRVAGVLIVIVSQFAVIGAYESLWAIFFDDLGASTWLIGVSYTLVALPIIAAAPIGGSVGPRVGPLPFAVASLAVSLLVVASWGFVTSLGVLLSLVVVSSFAEGMAVPAVQVAYASAVPEARLATAQGLVAGAEVLAAGFVAVPAAAIYGAHGAVVAWPSVAGFVALCVGIGVLLAANKPGLASSRPSQASLGAEASDA